MRILGLDLGTKTLGISLSDTTETIASALTTLRFKEDDYDLVLPELKEIIDEYQIYKIVLGAQEVLKFKEKLEEDLNMDVVLQDERLTTVSAHNIMIEASLSRKKRKEKIDALAANIILQTYLDKEKGRKL